MIMSRRRLLFIWTLFFTIVVLFCVYLSYNATKYKAQDVIKIQVASPRKSYIHHNRPTQLTTHKIHIKKHSTNPAAKTQTGPTKPKLCKPDRKMLVGAVYINKTVPRMQEVIEQLSVNYGGFVKRGGTFKPKGCISKNELAIIIPYRNRSEHLRIFLRHMHPIMQRQMHNYRIIVVEQAGNYSFNRATLINIGFLEALKISKFECFVFHDVDHILENDQNDYGCPESPKLLGVSVDRFHRRWPYKHYFGGVGAFSKEQFEKMNGYSNKYWGWGGEDDDAYNRIRAAGYSLTRPLANVGRYIMLKEHHVRAKAGGNRFEILHPRCGYKTKCKIRTADQIKHMLLKTSTQRMYKDGLNSVKYKVLHITEFPLYTHILAKLYEELDVTLNGSSIATPTPNTAPI